MFCKFKSCLLSIVLLCIAGSALAQDLRLVTVSRTPFSLVQNDVDTGFSLDLWAEIASELDLSYEITRVETFSEMLEAIETGAADVAAANISITADRELAMDFSQPIFAAGLRVMVPFEQSGGLPWMAIWNWDFLFAAVLAFGLLFGGGLLMWWLERDGGQAYFQGSMREKAFPSFWWALNLVVNGGFEERVPRSILGRLFATMLVVSSLFVVSLFVANITAVMTVNAIQSSVQSVNDLAGKTVGTTPGSTSASFMDGRGLGYRAYNDVEPLLAAFENGQLDAVVFDAPILSYYLNTTGAGKGQLIGPVFLSENYGFALQSDSPLREPINRVLLRLRENGTYGELLTKWFGTAEAG